VRMEDLDTARVVPGSADEIVAALWRYALEWDGDVVFQSHRNAMYERALFVLREKGLVYDCGCSRAELARSASAPLETEALYPGTCRNGLPKGRAPRAVRFRAPDDMIVFNDTVFGRVEEIVSAVTGDFVVKRADGPYAYQLAVVIDDAEQGVTEVVRGADLLSSTARQIALQRALELPTPRYAHLPLVVTADGAKVGKRDGALPLPTLEPARVQDTLRLVLRILGAEVPVGDPAAMLTAAVARFDPAKIRRTPFAV
jgi:glutamyl-Q tRNA(Asp) synthetase